MRAYRGTFIVVGLVALAVVSNPGKARHGAAIQSDMQKRHPVASLLGAGRLASAVADYHSLGVASYTTIDDKVATVGAFGFVVAR